LIEQAGGRASTGTENLMDVVPTKLHERTPLVIGSTEDVDLVESFFSKSSATVGQQS
jgi:fructose-1,6-bisphosphatase I